MSICHWSYRILALASDVPCDVDQDMEVQEHSLLCGLIRCNAAVGSVQLLRQGVDGLTHFHHFPHQGQLKGTSGAVFCSGVAGGTEPHRSGAMNGSGWCSWFTGWRISWCGRGFNRQKCRRISRLRLRHCGLYSWGWSNGKNSCPRLLRFYLK